MSAEQTPSAPEVAAAPAVPEDLAALVARAARGETTVILGPDGVPAAAMVPFATLAEIEKLRECVEDLEDGMACLESELETALTGEEARPLEDVLREHGL